MQRLNLTYDETLSNFAFKFNLRRYMSVGGVSLDGDAFVAIANAATVHYGRAVQVSPIKPTLKASGTRRSKLKFDEKL